MNGACAILGLVCLCAAAPSLAFESRRALESPVGALAQAGAPGGPSRTDDAATGSGRRVDPKEVRAVGGSTITPENAAQIANVLLATALPRDVAISAGVGAPLPGDVDVQPLPPSVTDLVPEFRGFVYAAANDRVVIVKPSTRQVVEVISADRGRP